MRVVVGTRTTCGLWAVGLESGVVRLLLPGDPEGPGKQISEDVCLRRGWLLHIIRSDDRQYAVRIRTGDCW